MTKPMTSDSEDKYQPLDTEVERSKFHASVRANTTAHSELAQEAQSEAPSVDSQIDEVFDWLLASYVDTDNVYIIEEMEEDRPIFKAKINRLITEARIDELKRISKFKGLEWPSTARATYIENRIEELS